MHILRRLVNRTAAHQQRLNHSLLIHIRYAPLLHVNSRELLSCLMALSQLRHNTDRMQTGILRQRVWNDLQRLGEGPRNHAICAGQRLNPLLELREDLGLGRTSAHQQRVLLHEAADHAESVMEGAVGLVENLCKRGNERVPGG